MRKLLNERNDFVVFMVNSTLALKTKFSINTVGNFPISKTNEYNERNSDNGRTFNLHARHNELTCIQVKSK